MTNIADRIRAQRLKNHMTQCEVATRLGIKVSNYQKYENGTRIPKDNRLLKLSQIFHCRYNDLKNDPYLTCAMWLDSYAYRSTFTLNDDRVYEAFYGDWVTEELAVEITDYFSSVANTLPTLYAKYLGTPTIDTMVKLSEKLYQSLNNTTETIPQDDFLPDEIDDDSDPCVLYAISLSYSFFLYLETIESEQTIKSDIMNSNAYMGFSEQDAMSLFACRVFIPILHYISRALITLSETDLPFPDCYHESVY